jgi:hypothetical protein
VPKTTDNFTMKTVALADLTPAPYNPRVALEPGDPQYDSLKASIETWGLVDPIIVNKKTGHVVGGHQRLSVLMDMGTETTQVIEVDVSETSEQALNVALNKVQGRWDEAALAAVLTSLEAADYDIALTGFTSEEMAHLLDDVSLYGAPPSLDDLEREHGTPLPDDFWPVLRLKVPPETLQLWNEVVFLAEGDSEHERLASILTAARSVFQ